MKVKRALGLQSSSDEEDDEDDGDGGDDGDGDGDERGNPNPNKITTPKQVAIMKAWHDEKCELNKTKLNGKDKPGKGQKHKFHCTQKTVAKKSFEKYRAARYAATKSDFPFLHSPKKLYTFLDGIYGQANRNNSQSFRHAFINLL